MSSHVPRGSTPRRTAATAATPSAPPPAPAPAAPPLARDPWSWLAALAVLPIVLHGLGAPLGEPVAEDFDFLRHNVLLGRHGLLDGGGSFAFWRPVSHQLYYWMLGDLILDHPRVVATLHAVLLALSAVLLARTLRATGWNGPRALAAAAFPFFMESARTVFSWPSHGVELTSLLFTVLALHEAARRRLVTCLVALVLALLSKEVAVVAALLIPLLPGIGAGGDPAARRRERLRWALAVGATTAAWAVAYLWVRHRAGLALPHQLESDPSMLRVSLLSRFSWATWNSLRAVMSMPFVNVPPAVATGLRITATAILAAGIGTGLLHAGIRGRARAVLPWIAWGLAWFVLSSATLTTIFPFWAPNRALFGCVGLGIAVVALLGAAWSLFPWAFLAVRLLAFAASPAPSAAIGLDPDATGAFMDFPQLTRLQLLMADTRGALAARFPTLPHGARVGQHDLPRRADYAFGGDHALQCWYRDTTLRWVRFEEYSRDSTIPLTTIVEYQPEYTPAVVLVEPAAMRTLLDGASLLRTGDLRGAEERFAAVEREQKDANARVLLGTALGMRGGCRMGLGDTTQAIALSRRALALYRQNADARYALALMLTRTGALDEAASQLDTLLAFSPHDRDARALREQVEASRH